MTEKKCNNCTIEKPLSEFHRQKDCLDGVRSTCKLCVKERKAKHYSLNKEHYQKRNTIWLKNNCRSSYSAQYREINKGKIKQYEVINKHLYAKNRAIRRARLLQRTPGWLTAGDLFEIECVYKYCGSLTAVGLKYEVDHIVPLASKYVSGLHVPENLQVIPKYLNRVKANKYDAQLEIK